MVPDFRQRRSSRNILFRASDKSHAFTQASSDDPHRIVYFKRHLEDDPLESMPGREYLRSCPTEVRIKFQTTLIAVAKGPPKKFAGGGRWEAMHGELTGWFEVRVDFARTSHHRLFCLIDTEAIGQSRPLLVVVHGGTKAYGTVFKKRFYDQLTELGDEYHSRNPRSIA